MFKGYEYFCEAQFAHPVPYLSKGKPWSIVLKAALKQSSTIIEHMPVSEFIKKSLVTLKSMLILTENPFLRYRLD